MTIQTIELEFKSAPYELLHERKNYPWKDFQIKSIFEFPPVLLPLLYCILSLTQVECLAVVRTPYDHQKEQTFSTLNASALCETQK